MYNLNLINANKSALYNKLLNFKGNNIAAISSTLIAADKIKNNIAIEPDNASVSNKLSLALKVSSLQFEHIPIVPV